MLPNFVKKRKLLMTFITPFKRGCFERFTSALEIYQRKISEVLKNIQGVKTIIDDVLIHSRTTEEHSKRLKTVLKTLQKARLKLKEKCEFKKTQLEYFGDIISGDGIQPNKERLKSFSGVAWTYKFN